MRTKTRTVLAFLIVFLGGLVYLGVMAARHGFSAREKPSRLEQFLARHARKIATPAGAKTLKNVYQPTEENLASARHHFVEHCSACHALDGGGNTVFGRNMYPKVSDLRDSETQKLADGEIFYVISNGVRFTGMPAFGGEDSPEEIWKLVLFIRRLPTLPPEELKEMERMATGAGEEPAGKRAPSHTDAPGSMPHQH